VQLDPEIKQAIELHPSDNVAQVSRDLTRQLGKHVPVTLVVKVRGSIQRAADVNRAKSTAATTLDEKVGRIDKASVVLEEIFMDDTLPLKERIEASKELRQWTKLGMDAAGIADSDSETLFVVEGDWLPFKPS
jgi:hypothetical protein